MAENKQTVTVDGIKYDLASLSKEARAALNNLGAVENEMRQLRTRQGIARVAQEVFARQLKAALPKAE